MLHYGLIIRSYTNDPPHLHPPLVVENPPSMASGTGDRAVIGWLTIGLLNLILWAIFRDPVNAMAALPAFSTYAIIREIRKGRP